MSGALTSNTSSSIADARFLPSMDSSEAPARILIAGSSRWRRQLLRNALSGFGVEIIEAVNTGDAVAAVIEKRVNLVLVDSEIGEMGGIEFCRLLKKTATMKFLPLFILSAVDDLEQEVKGIEAGADAYLVLPLQPRLLRARVFASLRQKALIDSLDDSEAVLYSLAKSMEDRDPGLGQHCERLAWMASALGSALGLAPEELASLQSAGFLHDIGKVAVPDHILFKQGPLTAQEWDVMMAHPERGERICRGMRSLEPVLPIIRHHHERWDGSGYPDKLKGEEIPLLARILQLADIYDALTMARPYKRPFTPEEAISVIRDEAARGWRDPRLVERFSEILPTLRPLPSGCDLSGLSLQALVESLKTRYDLSSAQDVHPSLWLDLGSR